MRVVLLARLQVVLKEWGLLSPGGVRGPVLTLLSGSTIAAGLTFLAQPILTRLYSPDEFGVLSYFMALLSVLVTLSSFQYESAVMQPENEEDAHNIIWLSLLLLLAATIVLGILAIWHTEIARALGMPEAGPWLVLIPPALLGFRGIRIAELWLIRAKRFGLVTGGQLAHVLAMTASRIAAALLPITVSAGGLVGGLIAGQVTAATLYVPTLMARFGRDFIRSFNVRKIRRLAARYRRFSLFSAPASTLNTLLSRLPFLLIPFFFIESDDRILGYFGQAVNVLAIPLGLVGGAVAQVLFVHASEAARSGQLAVAASRVHARLVAFGIFPTLVLVVGGPDILAVILGGRWREAGEYVQLLGPWLFLTSVAAPLTRIFDVLERQRLDLLTSVGMFAMLTAALVAGGLTGDLRWMLLLVGIVGVLARAVHIATMLRLAGVTPRGAAEPYIKGMLRSIPFLLPIGFTLTMGSAFLTTAIAVVSGICYSVLVLGRELRPQSEEPIRNEEAGPLVGSPASD